MKPLVGAMQAWSWYVSTQEKRASFSRLELIPLSLLRSFVISCFAIVILSILGLAFKNNHEEFVGGIEQPEDGPAVASTIFVAVLVYIVGGPLPAVNSPMFHVCELTNKSSHPGIPSILRPARSFAHAREPTRSDCPINET